MEIEDKLALHELVAEHWARVDRVTEELATDLYTDDAEIRIGTLEKTGRAQIAAYYLDRRSQEGETGRYTRHAATNLRIADAGPGLAELHFLCIVYAGRGTMPFTSAPPSNIADFTASCRKSEDGRWRFSALGARAIFAGPEAPANAR